MLGVDRDDLVCDITYLLLQLDVILVYELYVLYAHICVAVLIQLIWLVIRVELLDVLRLIVHVESLMTDGYLLHLGCEIIVVCFVS
jgi:type IV secretory pathway VirB3-like protein